MQNLAAFFINILKYVIRELHSLLAHSGFNYYTIHKGLYVKSLDKL